MYQVIIVVHVLLGMGIIGLVLMQQGKGADAGAAFGTGTSGSVFGAQGSASFLSRTTAIMATLFFITSLTLAVLGSHREKTKDLMSEPEVQQETLVQPKPDEPQIPEETPPMVPETPMNQAVPMPAEGETPKTETMDAVKPEAAAMEPMKAEESQAEKPAEAPAAAVKQPVKTEAKADKKSAAKSAKQPVHKTAKQKETKTTSKN